MTDVKTVKTTRGVVHQASRRDVLPKPCGAAVSGMTCGMRAAFPEDKPTKYTSPCRPPPSRIDACLARVESMIDEAIYAAPLGSPLAPRRPFGGVTVPARRSVPLEHRVMLHSNISL